MVAPIPLRCDSCGHKNVRSQDLRIGDRCRNPYINNGCDGNYAGDSRPNEPGYITQSQENKRGTHP